MQPYRYTERIRDEIENTIKELLELGLTRPSSSPYASSLVMVKKKDGTLRMWINFRGLNKEMKNRYPVPWIDELMDELHGAMFFSKIYLRYGYHHIKMKKEDITKTAFKFHYGKFEFVYKPFGLTNSHTTFKSCMRNIFHKTLPQFALVFFDDILIYSKTWKEHLHHLEVVLKILFASALPYN